MALWRDGMRLLAVGPSGLQYATSVRCELPQEQATSAVTAFFLARKGVQQVQDASQTLRFTRGSLLLARLSWLLPLPEKWAFQTIHVCIREDAGVTAIDLTYDAKMYFTLIVPPNQFENEASALRADMQSYSTPPVYAALAI